ncbi:APC family permease [Pectinatus frisingensis]|uniref:APC family permease n=1 Tax=Pectinatus frisingensis TaxID=865 RepID=UPI003D809ABD
MAKNKFGFWSIVLLGINAIIGSGIFLLPNKVYELMGTLSLAVIFFDMLLAIGMALCFAELSGLFNKNGGPYVYARAVFGNFVGFEVGFMKAAVSIIAWAAMANGFATALSAVWAPAAVPCVMQTIIVVLLAVLGILNILGVQFSKLLNNIVTVGKLLPLIFFIVIGALFIDGGNFTMTLPENVETGSFGAAALLIFYAFTGFESIATAAEDMDNPQKNLPRAILMVMLIVSAFYLFIQTVSIGVLGASLASTKTPIAAAAGTFMGSAGAILVTVGTLISIGGINIASSFLTPRTVIAIADDHMLPPVFSRYNRFGTPYVAIAFSTILAIVIALSGSFTQLAAISVVSRFTQYLPSCLAVIVLRNRQPDRISSMRLPLGLFIPLISVIVSVWLLVQSDMQKIIIGLGGLLIGVPFYFIMKKQYLNK